MKILFLPKMSPILPKGTRKMAAARIAEVATQLKVTAPVANSLPMAGRAMLTDEPMKGVRKELRAATIRAALLFAASSIIFWG